MPEQPIGGETTRFMYASQCSATSSDEDKVSVSSVASKLSPGHHSNAQVGLGIKSMETLRSAVVGRAIESAYRESYSEKSDTESKDSAIVLDITTLHTGITSGKQASIEEHQAPAPISTPGGFDIGIQSPGDNTTRSDTSGDPQLYEKRYLNLTRDTQNVKVLDRPNQGPFRMTPNPIQDAELVMAKLPGLHESGVILKKLVRPDRIRQILILGATGHIGQQIVRLLGLKSFSYTPTFHCLIRANGLEAAQKRLLAALENVCKDKAEAEVVFNKCRVWVGDATSPQFGLQEASYVKLTLRIEGIFVATGPTWEETYKGTPSLHEMDHNIHDKSSYYEMASSIAVHSWEHVFKLARTYRHKHIWAFLPLFYSVELFVDNGPPQTSTTCLLESHIPDIFSLNRLSISPHFNRFGSVSWCKGVVEAILKYAKQSLDYSVTIFRVPPFVFSSFTDLPQKLGVVRKPLMGWKVLKAMVQEGMMPLLSDHLYALLCQAVDEALKAAVDLSLAPKRVHWVYHVVDAEQLNNFNKDKFTAVLNKLGIYLKGVSWVDWCLAVEARGAASCLHAHISDLRELIKDTCLKHDRLLSISNTHFKHDLALLGQTLSWSDFEDFGLRQIRDLLHSHYFAIDSLGTFNTVQECMAEAINLSGGLKDFGPHIDLCIEGWSIFLKSVNSPKNPKMTFWGRVSIVRTMIVYLTTHLYMTERERICPQVLEEKIKEPIFVVGLNRAGTTFVHSMLGQDTQTFRCPVLLEMLFPYGEKGNYQPIGLEANDVATWEQDPRRQPTMDLVTLQMGSEMKQQMDAFHSRQSVSYEEDLVAFELVGRSYSLAAGFQADDFVDWLFAADGAALRAAYSFHKRLFQHLQYQRPGRRWIFKMPWHLWTIETLFETYPDAELIFVHRRPISAVQSWCGLESLLHHHLLESSNLQRIGQRAMFTMSRLIHKALQYQESLAMAFVQEHPNLQPPQSFFLNLYFDNMVESPIVALRGVYEKLGLGPISATAEKAMWSYMEDARRYRSSGGKAFCQRDLSDMGLTRKDIKQVFEKYYSMYFDTIQRERRLQEYETAKAIRQNAVQREKHFDDNGVIIMEGPSILERTGFNYARRSVETMLSYAKSKLLTPLQQLD